MGASRSMLPSARPTILKSLQGKPKAKASISGREEISNIRENFAFFVLLGWYVVSQRQRVRHTPELVESIGELLRGFEVGCERVEVPRRCHSRLAQQVVERLNGLGTRVAHVDDVLVEAHLWQ